MKDFTTWIFIGNNETDVKVELYNDGKYKIQEITVYDYDTGEPYNIEEVPKDKLAELEYKIDLEYGKLLTEGYFDYVPQDGMTLAKNAAEDRLAEKFRGEF